MYSLRKKTQKAEKIYKLLEKIGLDKIQCIKSYSANEISKFTNDEIQKIMDHFSNKPSTDFTEDQDNFINDDSSSQTDTSEVRANSLVSAEVSESTAPIPLTHVSNSSGDSSSSKKLDTKVEVVPPIPQPESLVHDRAYFRNKALDQYPNLYREFSSENFDYYGIIDETSCPLCKLSHDDEEGIEGRYEARSYFIKCEQREIEIVA